VVGQLNCVAVPAASASEVLKVIRRRRVDLVLLDLDFDLAQMGKVNTLHEIKQFAPMLPVVIMGPVMTPALARRLCDRGAQSFLVKPVGCDQLSIALFRYLL
jgi:DNA-binding NtrC family response regulator